MKDCPKCSSVSVKHVSTSADGKVDRYNCNTCGVDWKLEINDNGGTTTTWRTPP